MRAKRLRIQPGVRTHEVETVTCSNVSAVGFPRLTETATETRRVSNNPIAGRNAEAKDSAKYQTERLGFVSVTVCRS